MEEDGSAVGIGGGKAAMATSSFAENKNSVPFSVYPPPIAQYEDVIACPKLFLDILGKFHAAMGTKLKIPIIGGSDLDLHRLFMEVTSRGGIKKVLEEKQWREVTNCFNFPPSATNASFILRKYYMSLVYHFEQVYYFKAKAWTPVPTDTCQSTKTALASTSGMNQPALASPVKKQRMFTEEQSLNKGSPESSIGLPVTGVLDGKFESGYLCTVRIGGEQLQGVLYQTVQTPLYELPKHEAQDLTMVRCRRRRRKKSEIRKRDPAQPKPNRSGYNFFFADQHARLRSLHKGKDRGISRMVGEEWNKLTESEKAVYQEKAVKDKERYRSEMENYRENCKKGQVLTTSVSLEQQYFIMDTNMEKSGANSHTIHENEPSSESFDDDDDDSSSFEGEDETIVKDPNLEMGAKNVEIEHKESFSIDDEHVVFLDESGQQKSMSVEGMNH